MPRRGRMPHSKKLETEAAAFVAELYANGKSPMELFGINWAQAEMLERRNPGIVIKLHPDDGKICACV